MKSLLALLGVILVPSVLCSQITFQQFPKSLQLYPRSTSTNRAQIPIRGTAAPSADSLVFSVFKSDGSSQRQALLPDDLVDQQFELNFEIEAGLWSYQFKVEQQSGNQLVLLQEASNVVAGDVFVVQGQSNAQAVAYNGDANIWQSNFIRCFGTSNPDILDDQNWYIAEGNGFFSPGAIGQWALRMGFLLQEQLKIPIAVINGADPGKPIEFFQRNDAQANDPTTNYGRLLQRLLNAGVNTQIRAILYYQGESDSNRDLIHKTLFEALHADWETDLPNIEAYYIAQVREGCGSPNLQLREYQRAFEDYLNHAKAVTTNGINGHDGCHYDVEGYKTLGEKLYKQISADLYNTPTGEQTNIRVLSASFTDDLNTEITLITDATDLVAEPGCAFDFRIEGAGATVISVQAEGSKLILTLDQSVNLPNSGISYGGHAGSNAWVLNGDGYGMFTFYNLLIDNYNIVPNFDIPGIMSGSGNCISLDGIDDFIYVGPVLGSSYTKEAWVNWQGSSQLNNLISGVANTAFWIPNGVLSAGHNGAWWQVTDNTVLTPNQWTHVAVSYDAAALELRLYKNGKLVSQAQDIPAHNDPEVYVGAFSGCCTFQGKIDEARIWDRARTIEEIRADMCQKIPATTPNLSAYFRFDETAGNTAPNLTDGPDGQLNNFQGNGLYQAWQRSGAPIGTESTQSYLPVNTISLASAVGDSLVLSVAELPDFAHLYFVEETPNVLEAPEGYVLVDHSRYFGLFYPNLSISEYDLKYYYAQNPLANILEDHLDLLKRRSNAQAFWEETLQTQQNPVENTLSATGTSYQEYILAINDAVALNPLSAASSIAQPILCNGLTGVLEVSATGGIPPYTYYLNGGAPEFDGLFAGLAPGAYTVVVEDHLGTLFTTNPISLQSPPALAVSIQVTNNNAQVAISGGVAPYTLSSNAPNTDLQNLPNGTYTLLVTDANGCVFNNLFTIDYQALTSNISLIDNNLCDGLVDLLVVAAGGEPPYQYSLDNSNFQAANLFTDLPAGDYSVWVMDENGESINLPQVNLNIPPQLLASAIVLAGSILVEVSGGTLPYAYQLNGGATQSDSVFTGLLPGAYTLAVTDAAGCKVELNAEILTSSATALTNHSEFSISPNPSTGQFILQGKSKDSIVHISMLDNFGKHLQSFDIQSMDGYFYHSIHLEHRPAGLYVLQLSTPNSVLNFRLIKVD